MASNAQDRNKIKVVLDYPNLPYRPGDLICGNISGLPTGNHNIEYVQLEITGIAEYSASKAISGLDDKKRPIILGFTAQKFSACFLSGTCKIQPSESDDSPWRFSLGVPEATLAPGYNTKVVGTFNEPSERDTKRGRFIPWPSAHPLPPTMTYAYGVIPDGRLPRFADVRYALSVRAVKRGTRVEPTSERGISDKTYFWLTSLCGKNEIMPSPKAAWTRRGNNDFTAKADSSLRKKGLPKEVSMRVSINAPEYTHVNESGEIDFDIGMEVRGKAKVEKAAAKHIVVEIESLEVWLEREWCGYGEKMESFTNTVGRQSVSLSQVTGGRPFRATEDGTAYLDAEVRHLPGLVRTSVTPDFASWHLSLRHRLHFKADLICCGKRTSVQVTVPIRVLPKPRRPTDVGLTDGFVQGPQDIREDWADPTVVHQMAHEERDKACNATKAMPLSGSEITGAAAGVADLATNANSCSIM